MKILVIGSGGREHALAWKLAQSDKTYKIYIAPGNGGTAQDDRFENVPITDVKALCDWAQAQKIGLTVVGPEVPLAAGVVDEFRRQGLRIFGPTQAAAQLESSKVFAKAFMKRHNIPTAEFETFSDAASAHAHIDHKGAPIVIKVDGLAAGKGVVVATTLAQAHEAVDAMLKADEDGTVQSRVVIEEFLPGEEASFIVMVDGKNVLPLATSQDHKRLLNGDFGPNTGGMGAYSPAPVVTPNVHARVIHDIILPTVRGLGKDGIVFTGFLYVGLMIDADGNPKTLEFNCRMGDPETQPIMMRLKTDLVDVLMAATEPGLHGKLDQVELQWDRRTALGVVLAAHGYPQSPRTGDNITGLPPETEDSCVFHAGTVWHNDQLRTSGGRVLCVTALADNVRLAQHRAYEVAAGIHFDGLQYRTDIGYRAIKGAAS
jgi:phosphoribosylamine--glycine ligase